MDGNSKETQTEKAHPLSIIFLSLIISLHYSLVTQDPHNGHYQGNRKPKAQIPHNEICYWPHQMALLKY